MWAGAATLTVAALSAGLLLTAGPAYADVTSNVYTIGSPSHAVTNVASSPSAVGVAASTNFEVTFTVAKSLSGNSSDWVSVVPSTPLGSTPANIDLVGSSCVQAGTNGGAFTASGITVNLNGSCSLAGGSKAEVDFQADAPASTGTFTFAVTTTQNATPATSNTVTVSTGGPALTAATYGLGANTVYTISNASIGNLTSSGANLTMKAAATSGAQIVNFINSPTGAGYSVTYTPSGGSATKDTVTSVAASGASVTLTLSTALANNDNYVVTASGTNPDASGTANDVTVQVGNATAQTTNAINFGGSVAGVSVAPSTTVAGGSATYSITFRASDAAAAGGDIYLTEDGGPTNFTSTIGIEVDDTTQNWHFVSTGAVLSSGSATIPLADNVRAGDTINIIVANVTNPNSAGSISDFTVATTGDPVAVDTPAYTIHANGSPGVVVTVNPNTTGTVATYTIANLRAHALLTAGTATIQLVAPAGTVFPNNPAFFSISDSTSSSGSGTVSAALAGGGTSTVTFTVPETINAGDAFSVTVADVLNPSTASSSDTIDIENANVTGPTAVPVTTTTTSRPTTTTTKPPVKKPHRPVISDLDSKQVSVTKTGTLDIKLRCTGASCRGTVTLADVSTEVSSSKYSAKVGKTVTVPLKLNSKGLGFIKGAKKHTITVHVTISVTGGSTVKVKTALVGV